MTTDVHAALEATTGDYNAALARHGQLVSELDAAKAAGKEASAAADRLLASATQGAEVATDALVDARASADRVKVLVEIASAKVKGFWPTLQEAHVKLIQAQVEVEQAKLDAAIAAAVASAEDVDAAMAKVHEAMAVQRDKSRAAEEVARVASQFNNHVAQQISGGKLLPESEPHMHRGLWPRVNVPHVSGPRNVRAELVLDEGRNRVDFKLRPIPSLAVLVRGR
jgi:hypothetical protein